MHHRDDHAGRLYFLLLSFTSAAAMYTMLHVLYPYLKHESYGGRSS